MKLSCIESGMMGNNTYVLIDDKNKVGVIIDPARRNRTLENFVANSDSKFEYILLTHGHFDHVWDAKRVKDATGAKIAIHHADAAMLEAELVNAGNAGTADILLEDGMEITCGEICLKIVHTPGHTSGSVCIICGEYMFTGDTLFKDSIGRTDLGGNNEEMMATLKKLAETEGEYKVFPGHGEATTLEREKAQNRFLCFWN